MLFFAIVYVVEGIGQARVGIIYQPLTWFLKVTGWTPVQVTAYLAVLNFPWIIKPLFGLVSDFVPLFGYRRKSYLIVASLCAIGAYAAIARLSEPGAFALLLVLTSYAMATASTLCGALLAENGQSFRVSSRLVSQQWLWFYIAIMASSLAGGALIERLPPLSALQAAAAVAAVAPIAVVLASLFLLEEKKATVSREEMRRTFQSLASAAKSAKLYLVALFLFLYSFAPGFGTPLYYVMTDELKFSQAYIGILGSIASAGWIAGALVHRWLLARMSSKALLYLSIVLGTLSAASYLLLSGEVTAAIVNFANGAAMMIATIATLTLAADYCPRRSEGFAFAGLMSISNLAEICSNTIGAFLYEHVFSGRLGPLIIVSAATTAFAAVLVPLLRLDGRTVAKVVATTVPADSALQPWLAESDFCDAYEVALPPSVAALSPTELFLRGSRGTPRWIDTLMWIRNRVVRLFGLKDVGPMATAAKAPDAYRIGDRIGIFSIFGQTENELVLGIDDRHLDVRVSIMKSYRDGLPYFVVSTAVQVHNLLGRLYMMPVGRIHPFVVKSMMGRSEA